MDRASRNLMTRLDSSEFEFVTGLDALSEQGARFWAEAAVPSFFLSRTWFECLLSAGLDASDRIALGVLRSGGRVLALLPTRYNGRSDGLAREIHSLTGPYACLYRPVLLAHAVGRGVARSLGRHLGHSIRPGAIVHFDAVDAAWPELEEFEAGLREAGFRTFRYQHFGNWWEPLARRSFEGYLAARKGSLREIVRRRGRALKNLGARFEVHSTGDGVESAVASYELVYSRSWKEPEPFPRFHGVLIRSAASEGLLRFGSCWLGDRPIAVQLWIHWAGSATVLKLAHDQEFDRLSPGSVLLAYMIEQAIREDGVREIDFGRGDDAYKRDWATQRRQRIGLIAANPRSLRGGFVLAKQVAGQWFSSVKNARRSSGGGPLR